MTVDGYSRWKSFLKKQNGFLNVCRASDIRVIDYSPGFPGCIELTWYSEDSPVKYSASDKDFFVNALEDAKQISFVADVEEGYIELNIFPES